MTNTISNIILTVNNTSAIFTTLIVTVLLVIAFLQRNAIKKLKNSTSNVKDLTDCNQRLTNELNEARVYLTDLASIFKLTVINWPTYLIKEAVNTKGNFKQLKLIPNENKRGYKVGELRPGSKETVKIKVSNPIHEKEISILPFLNAIINRNGKDLEHVMTPFNNLKSNKT